VLFRSLNGYFCQLTPAIQVLELGVGNETITKSLNQVTQGKLLKIQASESLAQAKEAELRQIQEQQSFDFILIHPQSSQKYLQEALSLFLPRMHAQGILVLEGIHHSQGHQFC
jgi:predicted O-methyltransferase YrrM